MKKSFLFFCFSLIIFWISAQAHAIVINDPANYNEMHLCDIWDTVLGDNFDGDSQALFESYGVDQDSWWYETNGGIHAEVRYAGYAQAFGYITDKGEKVTLAEDIAPGIHDISQTPIDFQLDQGTTFVWFEYWKNQDYWYSDTTMNPDEKDHFVAFEVPEALYPDYNPKDGKHRMFLLAFEDLSLGDQDYNDLVVLVNAVAPAPVPEPATMVLLGVGLIGLGGLRRKFIR